MSFRLYGLSAGFFHTVFPGSTVRIGIAVLSLLPVRPAGVAMFPERMMAQFLYDEAAVTPSLAAGMKKPLLREVFRSSGYRVFGFPVRRIAWRSCQDFRLRPFR